MPPDLPILNGFHIPSHTSNPQRPLPLPIPKHPIEQLGASFRILLLYTYENKL